MMTRQSYNMQNLAEGSQIYQEMPSEFPEPLTSRMWPSSFTHSDVLPKTKLKLNSEAYSNEESHTSSVYEGNYTSNWNIDWLPDKSRCDFPYSKKRKQFSKFKESGHNYNSKHKWSREDQYNDGNIETEQSCHYYPAVEETVNDRYYDQYSTNQEFKGTHYYFTDCNTDGSEQNLESLYSQKRMIERDLSNLDNHTNPEDYIRRPHDRSYLVTNENIKSNNPCKGKKFQKAFSSTKRDNRTGLSEQDGTVRYTSLKEKNKSAYKNRRYTNLRQTTRGANSKARYSIEPKCNEKQTGVNTNNPSCHRKNVNPTSYDKKSRNGQTCTDFYVTTNTTLDKKSKHLGKKSLCVKSKATDAGFGEVSLLTVDKKTPEVDKTAVKSLNPKSVQSSRQPDTERAIFGEKTLSSSEQGNNGNDISVNSNKIQSESVGSEMFSKVNKEKSKDRMHIMTSKLEGQPKVMTEDSCQFSTSSNELDAQCLSSSVESQKLAKLTEVLEKSKHEISAYNKELLSRLVNFPRTRKEQNQLRKWIHDYTQSSKKLTLPRFNLQMGPSASKECSPSTNDIDPKLNSLVTEVELSELSIDVLSSIVHMLEDDSETEIFSLMDWNSPRRNICSNLSSTEKEITESSKQPSVLEAKTHDSLTQFELCSVSRDSEIDSVPQDIFLKPRPLKRNEPDNDFQQNSGKKSQKVIDSTEVIIKQECEWDRNEAQSESIENEIASAVFPVGEQLKCQKGNMLETQISACQDQCMAPNSVDLAVSIKTEPVEPEESAENTYLNSDFIVQEDELNVVHTDVNTSETETEHNVTQFLMETSQMHSGETQFNSEGSVVNGRHAFLTSQNSEQTYTDSCLPHDHQSQISTIVPSTSVLPDFPAPSLESITSHIKSDLNSSKCQSTYSSSGVLSQETLKELMAVTRDEETIQSELKIANQTMEHLLNYLQMWKNRKLELQKVEKKLRMRRNQLVQKLQKKKRKTKNCQETTQRDETEAISCPEDGSSIPGQEKELGISVEDRTAETSFLATTNTMPDVSLTTVDLPNNSSTIINPVSTTSSVNDSIKVTYLGTYCQSNMNMVQEIAGILQRQGCSKVNAQNLLNSVSTSHADSTTDLTQEAVTKLNPSDSSLQEKVTITEAKKNSSKKRKLSTEPTSSSEVSTVEESDCSLSDRVIAKSKDSVTKTTDQTDLQSEITFIEETICLSPSKKRKKMEKSKNFSTLSEDKTTSQHIIENESFSTKKSRNKKRKCSADEKLLEDVSESVSDGISKSNLPDATSRTAEDKVEWQALQKEIQAHQSAVVVVKIHRGYLYSASSDTTAKRFDFQTLEHKTTYKNHKKLVSALHVEDKKNVATHLYSSSHDGFLRCFEVQSGRCLQEIDLGSGILCMTAAWGRLFLGLKTGYIVPYIIQREKKLKPLECSASSISRIYATTEGLQKLLCIAAYDGLITVRNSNTGLLLRYFEQPVQPPCCLQFVGTTVYVSTAKKTLRIHDFLTGKLEKTLDCKSSATGMEVLEDKLLVSSFDGFVRCYRRQDLSLQCCFYGAGKAMVLCLDVYKNMVVTGNHEGKIEVSKFDPSKGLVCMEPQCGLTFTRYEDLEFHKANDHLPST
ncbi:uncharacterized protein LOC143231029 isoform X2 [Tachypleus tridentatus]